jgi:hypothetical protein
LVVAQLLFSLPNDGESNGLFVRDVDRVSHLLFWRRSSASQRNDDDAHPAR